jgi:hypothetical protein
MKTMARRVDKRVVWLVALLLPACASQPAGSPEKALAVRESAALPAELVLPEPRPATARQSVRFSESRHGNVVMSGVAFDARDYRLRVVDQDGGPGSEFADAAAVGRAMGGVAVVNAGFFPPEGKPLGLVVAEGRAAGVWNDGSSLGSALWREERAGGMAIIRRSAKARASAPTARNLLQSGPLLVEHGQPVSGLDESKTSARSFLIWDGGQRWWLGTCTPVSLAGLARILASDPPSGWASRTVLNLDGGRSSDLWVSAVLAGSERSTRMPWNRPVRNFLVIMPQS